MDELKGLTEEKAPRILGDFILHEQFSPEFFEENAELKDLYKNLNRFERVFVQDHDFFCCQRVRNEEVDEMFARGLEMYIQGDWIGAQTNFMRSQEILGKAKA